MVGRKSEMMEIRLSNLVLVAVILSFLGGGFLILRWGLATTTPAAFLIEVEEAVKAGDMDKLQKWLVNSNGESLSTEHLGYLEQAVKRSPLFLNEVRALRQHFEQGTEGQNPLLNQSPWLQVIPAGKKWGIFDEYQLQVGYYDLELVGIPIDEGMGWKVLVGMAEYVPTLRDGDRLLFIQLPFFAQDVDVLVATPFGEWRKTLHIPMEEGKKSLVELPMDVRFLTESAPKKDGPVVASVQHQAGEVEPLYLEIKQDEMVEEWLTLIVQFYQSLVLAYQQNDATVIKHLDRNLQDLYRADITHYSELEVPFAGHLAWIILDAENIQIEKKGNAGQYQVTIPILLQGSSMVFDPTQLTKPTRTYTEEWTDQQRALQVILLYQDKKWRIISIQPEKFMGSTQTMMWKAVQ